MATSTKQSIILILNVVAAMALMAFVWFYVVAPRFVSEATSDLGQGTYQLQSSDGQVFSQSTLEEGPTLVFFGFTHCPDVCPTTLGDIALWQEELGAQAEDLNVYFVTVDPERDTIDLVGDYVHWLPNARGVTGTKEEMAKAIRSFRVYSKRVPLDDGGYTMDHSAHVLLFDRKGRFFEPIGYQEATNRVIDKLKRLMAI